MNVTISYTTLTDNNENHFAQTVRVEDVAGAVAKIMAEWVAAPNKTSTAIEQINEAHMTTPLGTVT